MKTLKAELSNILIQAKGDENGIRALILTLQDAIAKAHALEFQAKQTKWTKQNSGGKVS